MKLEQSFTVDAPVEQVWAALVDVERVAPCLPGAQLTEQGDDGSYHGQFTVKLGPTTAAYNGTLKMEELDEAGHVAVMSARGTDRRGQGGATATIRSAVRGEGDSTRVDVLTDFTITGRLARFGRGGMIEDVSKRLLREFAACLESTISAGGATASAPSASEGPAQAETGPAGAPSETEAAAAVATAQAAAAGATGAGAGVPVPPVVPPPGPPGGGAPPGPAAPPPAAATAGTAEGGPAAQPQPAKPQPAKPLNAFELLLGVLKDRLAGLWKRLGAWLRARSRRSS